VLVRRTQRFEHFLNTTSLHESDKLTIHIFAATMPESDSPPRTRASSLPSMLSPVGNAGDYTMTIDDDSLDLDMSPVPQEGSTRHDEETPWHYIDGEEDDDQPNRFRLDSGLHTPLISHSREPARLNGLNFLNVVAYFTHVFVSYGIGVWGLGGILPTRTKIISEFETLVSPAGWAYYIWAPILGFEAIFAMAQLFPHYRARPIIQQGTGYFFFYTCIIQIAWTLFFSFKIFILSFVAVVAAFLSLASLLASQHYSQLRGRKSLMEYWLFKFPFYLHCGWLIVCGVVQFSMFFRQFTSDGKCDMTCFVCRHQLM